MFAPIEENCAKIKLFNETFQADDVGLFSWAVWNQKDVDVWNKVKDDFEIEMTLKFNHCWSIETYIGLVKAKCNLPNMDNMDFFDFYDKEQCLFDLMLHGMFDDYHVVLFDDAVKSCSAMFTNSKLEIFNIDEYGE